MHKKILLTGAAGFIGFHLSLKLIYAGFNVFGIDNINDYKILSGALYMNADEDNKIYKEIIKDFLCISPVYGKKIARMVFNKDLKCGNIFMSMEEAANENNKIDLDKNDTDTNNVPITNLYYKKSKETLTSAKKILE